MQRNGILGTLLVVCKRNRNCLQRQQESPFFEGCFCQNKDCFVYFEFTLRASSLIPHEPDDLKILFNSRYICGKSVLSTGHWVLFMNAPNAGQRLHVNNLCSSLLNDDVAVTTASHPVIHRVTQCDQYRLSCRTLSLIVVPLKKNWAELRNCKGL